MFLGSREAGTSVLDPCHMTAVEMFPDTPSALRHHMDQNGMGKKSQQSKDSFAQALMKAVPSSG